MGGAGIAQGPTQSAGAGGRDDGDGADPRRHANHGAGGVGLHPGFTGLARLCHAQSQRPGEGRRGQPLVSLVGVRRRFRPGR